MEFLGETALRILIYIVAVIIVSVIASYIKKARNKRDIKKYPSQIELKKIKDKVRILKQKDNDYNSIISTLKTEFAYSKGIIQGIIIDVENEAKTILDSPNTIQKSAYSFKYPKNWKISPLDKDLDEDSFFIIEGSYSGIIMFSIYNDVEDFPSLSTMNESIGKEYTNFELKDEVNTWGQFNGEGNTFTAFSMNNPCIGSIFRYKNNTHAFIVANLSMVDDLNNVNEGFHLVEKSFTKALPDSRIVEKIEK